MRVDGVCVCGRNVRRLSVRPGFTNGCFRSSQDEYSRALIVDGAWIMEGCME